MLTLYETRHEIVYALLLRENIKSVLDLGCGDGKFLLQLSQDSFFTMLAGVDNSPARLSKAQRRCSHDSRVTFHLQSFFSYNEIFKNYDGIVIMETIEHLTLEELQRLILIVFARLTPRLVIMTTPNCSYNSHYPVLYNGLRHPSHKFEFTETEFFSFGSSIVHRFSDYKFMIDFCDSAHASQLILFQRVT